MVHSTSLLIRPLRKEDGGYSSDPNLMNHKKKNVVSGKKAHKSRVLTLVQLPCLISQEDNAVDIPHLSVQSEERCFSSVRSNHGRRSRGQQ
jgi:hypothetical protein